MARKRSYTAKSNSNNLLGTFIHNSLVNSIERNKKIDKANKAIAKKEEMEAKQKARIQEAEVARLKKEAERQKLQAEKERLALERHKEKKLKQLEAERKIKERENERFNKYRMKLELYCKKNNVDLVCLDLMAAEAHNAGLSLGKELEDLIILGREQEWGRTAIEVEEKQRKEDLNNSIEAWIESENLYNHESIDALVNKLKSLADVSKETVDKFFCNQQCIDILESIKNVNFYYKKVEENIDDAIVQLNILPRYRDDFLDAILEKKINYRDIVTSDIGNNFKKLSEDDIFDEYCSNIQLYAEKLVDKDLILERDIVDFCEELIELKVELSCIDNNQVFKKYSNRKNEIEDEIMAKIMSHVS